MAESLPRRRPIRPTPPWKAVGENTPIGIVWSLVEEMPFAHGKLIDPIALDTTAKEIHHGLGRPAKGYLVLTQDAFASICRVDLDLSGLDEKKAKEKVNAMISLKASAPVNVSLWVF